MAKKSPSRARRGSSKRGPAKRGPTKRAPPRRAAPPRAAAPKPPRLSNGAGERLREAMEELEVAHQELSRLGHDLTATRRELEERKLSSVSAESNLRAELDATRTDLKTALAELEIARAEVARLRYKLGINAPAS